MCEQVGEVPALARGGPGEIFLPHGVHDVDRCEHCEAMQGQWAPRFSRHMQTIGESISMRNGHRLAPGKTG